MDKLSPEKRSSLMSKVRGKDTGIEIVLRKRLWKKGLRYRKNCKIEDINIDLAFMGRRVAVFVDGCFWHGCPEHYSAPASRSAFWKKKINDNVARDIMQTNKLKDAGWTVIRVWEHDIKHKLDCVVDEIINSLAGHKAI